MKKVVSLLLCVMLILMVSACGEAEKTPTTTPQKTDAPAVDYAPYEAKIKEYEQALAMDDETFDEAHGELDCSSINGNVLMLARAGGGTISYTRYDVDSNGVEELLFSNDWTFVDAYTLKDGKLIKLFEDCDFGYRTAFEITSKGEMVIQWGNALEAELEVWKLSAEGTAAEKVAAYYVDTTTDTPDRDDAQFMNEEEFTALAERYDSVLDTLAWTKIKR